jgi:DNA-binding NtrC family response regulator
MTAYGTVETAVDAIKLGAYDFILKPFSPDQTDVLIEKATNWLKMNEKQIYLNKELDKEVGLLKEIIGKSKEIQEINKLIQRVATSHVTVLVTGESGTGKELVASAIEGCGNPSKKAPYIRMNCAAVPENLIESEMFGHEKGAFTGANERRVGRFELADGGTLLLDEIGEVPLSMQAKLLRVLQESEFERVGGNKTIKVNVRIIATTNRDLKTEVKKGNFREDLFYRLNVVPLKIPPLRERTNDAKVIAAKLLERINQRQKRQLHFSDEALNCLSQYPWPGNVRELENFIERLAVLEDGPEIGLDAMPDYIRSPERLANDSSQGSSSIDTFNLHDIERETIKRALVNTGGNRSKAADLLGFSVRTLRNKLAEYKSSGEWNAEAQLTT